jgi:hypothetical protein
MIHLQSIALRTLPEARAFPFSLPVLQSLAEMEFSFIKFGHGNDDDKALI